MSVRHIIDNEVSTVAGYLRQNLSGADAFRFVSAYFTIYGYELLEQELNDVADVRLQSQLFHNSVLSPVANRPGGFVSTGTEGECIS